MAGLAAAFNGLRTLMDRRSILDGVARGSGATRATAFVATRQITPQGRGLLCGPIDEGVDCLAADGPQPRFVDASIVRYLAALDRADRDESDVAEARTTRIKDKIARLRQQMQALQAMKEKVQDAPDQQISLTDPDARSMATSGGGTGLVGYNVQTAVDAEHHLIVAHEVINVGHDRAQLEPIIAYIDDYKLLMIATIAVLPLLVVFKVSRRLPAVLLGGDGINATEHGATKIGTGVRKTTAQPRLARLLSADPPSST